MAHATKSPNNPYGLEQVPEWEFWEDAARARADEVVCQNEMAGWDHKRSVARARARAIAEALTKLRPPNGGS